MSIGIEIAATLHPILALKIAKTRADIAMLPGFPARLTAKITDGIRDDSAQEEKFKAGLSNAQPGLSAHKYGLAGHITYFDRETGQPEWNDVALFQRAQSIGYRNGLKTGITWKNSRGEFVQDWLHFELAVAPIRLVKQTWEDFGGDWLRFNQWVTKQYLEGGGL